MLLVEITIDSTVHRVSNEDIPLTYLWKSYVADLSDFQIKLPKKHGGYEKPEWGDISFSPELFADNWPPQVSCPIKIKTTLTTEAAAVTLFSGTAHLRKIGETKIDYDLYQPEYDTSVDGQAFNDTLVNIVSWACDATRLNLTLDSTDARATIPPVIHTTNDVILLDEISNICAGLSHRFNISDGTLTLVDCLHTGTATSIDAFDTFKADYDFPKPYSKFKTGNASIDGSHAYGDEYTAQEYHTTAGTVETALADIKTLVELPETELSTPIATAPAIGTILYFIDDESKEGTITTTMWVQEVNYNFNTGKAVVKCLVTSIA